MAAALAAGLGLGILTAAQVGPIWLLCLRSTLRGGFRVGVAIGAGAAVVDMVYAALGVAGASRLLEIDPLRVALGVAGAVVLALLGLRTLWSAFRIRLGGETAEEVASPRRAFLTSLGATASNPLTIVDPLRAPPDPPEGAQGRGEPGALVHKRGRPVAIFVSIPWHLRSAAELVERFDATAYSHPKLRPRLAKAGEWRELVPGKTHPG